MDMCPPKIQNPPPKKKLWLLILDSVQLLTETRSQHLPPWTTPPSPPGPDHTSLPPLDNTSLPPWDQVTTPPSLPSLDNTSLPPPWDQVTRPPSLSPSGQHLPPPPPPPGTRSQHFPPSPRDQVTTPPPGLCAGGRYASYWNAFLLITCVYLSLTRYTLNFLTEELVNPYE